MSQGRIFHRLSL